MNILVRGLTPSRDRTDYYELWLTKGGRLADPFGRFTVHSGVTKVVLASRTGCASTTAGSSPGAAHTCR